ncbi:uncharacterized protein [Maniola hyperantus]|uniref:uncharacterized protein n=1 Tax=Aphantopus hyperantus TaxID=2795564 RepID=UPI0015681859|nr:uncharacterized protein LOC117984866 [Maniola hyperantus]
MEVPVFFLVLTVLWKTSSCVRCFKCFPENTYYHESNLLCKQFDDSDKFLENCTKSTMCFKRVTTLSLADGMTSVSVHRGCASQSLGQEQVKVNGKWLRQTIIHDNVYEEKCIEDLNDLDRPTKTLNCYCRGDYCNGSIANFIDFKTILLTFLFYVYQFR